MTSGNDNPNTHTMPFGGKPAPKAKPASPKIGPGLPGIRQQAEEAVQKEHGAKVVDTDGYEALVQVAEAKIGNSIGK